MSDMEVQPDANAAQSRRRSPLQVPAKVTEWLYRCYTTERRCQVPKAALYEAYEEFCRSQKLRPKPPNVFGKIIKQVYPHVGTSRMGSHLHQVPYYTGLAPRVVPPHQQQQQQLHSQADNGMVTPPGSPSRDTTAHKIKSRTSGSPSPPLLFSPPPSPSRSVRSSQPSLPHLPALPLLLFSAERGGAGPYSDTNNSMSAISIPIPRLAAPTPVRPLPIRREESADRMMAGPPMSDEDRMLKAMKEKFLSYTQPLQVK